MEENALIELSVNVSQIREFLNEIAKTPQKIFEVMRLDVRETMGRFLNHNFKTTFGEIPFSQ